MDNEELNKKIKGGLKKIKDFSKVCLSSEHNVPNHMQLSPGIYEWTCSACGHITKFTVPLITCSI